MTQLAVWTRGLQWVALQILTVLFCTSDRSKKQGTPTHQKTLTEISCECSTNLHVAKPKYERTLSSYIQFYMRAIKWGTSLYNRSSGLFIILVNVKYLNNSNINWQSTLTVQLQIQVSRLLDSIFLWCRPLLVWQTRITVIPLG